MELISIALDGAALAADRYRIEPGGDLAILDPPDAFTLDIAVRIKPQLNTALSGLYMSGGNFCTQCEPEGFRRITWFLDRPDVMARYSVTHRGRQGALPGAAVERQPGARRAICPAAGIGRTGSIRTRSPPICSRSSPAIWSRVEDSFTTRSGREVALAIWVRRGDEDKCGHAMASLKESMRWDEEIFGLEYDLDVFNIVAVSDFNMGAMENKGLNVFNTRYVLAKPDTATDTDYQNIEAVIAHEYFHNWTGNRVTCRDWFQLSLKEGLTVFRDQQFSADQGSAAVCRIADVRALARRPIPRGCRAARPPGAAAKLYADRQFLHGDGLQQGRRADPHDPHPAGPRGVPPRHGSLYPARTTTHAATIEDFVAAMQDASGVDLGEFTRWYQQAGTPEITVEDRYDPASRSYELTVSQKTPPTPGQPDKSPMPIPLAMGLIGPNGDEMPTRLDGEAAAQDGTRRPGLQPSRGRAFALSMSRRRRCRRCCAASRRRSSCRACRSTG